MRYFYYGPEKAKETAVESSEEDRRQKQEDDLVIEEDTIYEIDRECERAGREFQRDSGKAVMKNGTEKEKAAP